MIKNKKLFCALAALSMVWSGGLAAEASSSDADENMRAALAAVNPDDEYAESESTAKEAKKDKNKSDKSNKGTANRADEYGDFSDFEDDEPAAEESQPAPITLEGDDIFFDEKTGDVYAKGNVVVTQSFVSVYADDMTGNTQRQEVQVEDKATIVQPNMNLDGYNTSYNYGVGEGTMERANGRVGNEFVKGETIEFYPEEYIIYNGAMTKCPAKKPDYYTRAKKVEIWPDEKMIAYDAQFVVKDVTLYSTKRYETKIGKNASKATPFPSVGYSSDNGVYVKQEFQYPVVDNVYAYFDAAYYSKQDFKPMGGFVYDNDKFNYTFKVNYGYTNDSDDNWIRKKPEYEFRFHSRRFFDTAWSYSAKALYGLWEDRWKQSHHQDYSIYFARDTIHLTDTWQFNVGAGYEIVRESVNDSRVNTITYDARLGKRINDRMNGWTAFHHSKADAQSIFDYDNDNIEDKLTTGASYRFDNKNSLSVSHVLNVNSGHTNDWYYTWYHNLHCWNLFMTYHRDIDDNDNKFTVLLQTAHW